MGCDGEWFEVNTVHDLEGKEEHVNCYLEREGGPGLSTLGFLFGSEEVQGKLRTVLL